MNRERSKLLLAACALSTLLLSACNPFSSIMESKKIDYKSAGKIPSLEIPPDLTTPSADDRYVVPDVGPKGTATFSVYDKERSGAPRTGSTNLLPEQGGKIRLERSGSQRWLVVPGDPEKMWPVIKDFWQETGFIVNVENPTAGVMETDWAENRAKIPQDALRNLLGKVLDSLYSTAERDKFRTRLERGLEPGTTEIYISHRGMYEVYATEGKDQTVWQPRPADPELEAEMLRRLMVRFGVQESQTQAVLAAGFTPQAKLSKASDGVGLLTLNDGFDRAWRRVGLALDRVGFTVEDRDRSKGLYFVRYVDPQIDVQTKKPSEGVLSKLLFWRSTPKVDKNKLEQYRIQVKEAVSGTQVQVLNQNNAPENNETANKILNLLLEQLK